MKINQNNTKVGNYYIGLDTGTNSVGWAITDTDYNLKRFQGKDEWGIRLFDDANNSSERRTAREARRRLDRRKQRLNTLEVLFDNEMSKVDPLFYVRLHESNLWEEDRKVKSNGNSLFNDPDFTDKDYLKKYPTIYHLRSELIHSDKPHDVRLVFLAVHHIIKYRGHFLYENSDDANGKTFASAVDDLKNYLNDNWQVDFRPASELLFEKAIYNDTGKSVKKKEISGAYGEVPVCDGLDFQLMLDMLSGASVSLAKLFKDDSLNNLDTKNMSLDDDLESKYDELSPALGERFDLITYLKTVYDVAMLNQVLGGKLYLSDAKVQLYEKNHEDLLLLKKYVKENAPDKYKHIFSVEKGVNNFAAYSRYKTDEVCSQEDFCKFLRNELPDIANEKNSEFKTIAFEISENKFYTKLKGSENGLIPYQLQLRELKKILENASNYLSFLNEKDDDGLSVSDKIIATFTYKIPFYVGPLNVKSPNAWVVRKADKITPWNFNQVVDLDQSAQKFMSNLISRCTYTGEPVLPMDSLLFSKFRVLNDLNQLKVNGNKISVDVKQKLYVELFEKSNHAVTKKRIISWLLANGYIEQNDKVDGVDEKLTSNLKPWHDFKQILTKTKDYEMVEEIIEHILVYGDDKKMLRRWLIHNTHGLNNEDIKYICRLKYKEWERLSKIFLTEIYSENDDGEVVSIIDMMWNTNSNLMELMSNKYHFRENAEKYRREHFDTPNTISAELEQLYIAPAVKRSIMQSLRVVDELVDVNKSAPKKIFIEMARPNAKDVKKERTTSRKQTLLKLYKDCKQQESELYKKLESEDERNLRRDKLYLYYTQFGKCMYSGEPIDLELAMKNDDTYDIDHIFPKSRRRDNSIDNRVLVKSVLNREKTNEYPIKAEIRERMQPFWEELNRKGLISDTKLERLERNYPLTEEELSEFVASQLNVTQQSTKALAEMLRRRYPNTKIVYSKAGNVSDFRQEFEIRKNRDVNDLHHAKDAYLNIVVGNVYDTKFTEKFFLNIKHEKYSLNKVFDFDTKGAWVVNKTINTVRKVCAKNTVLFVYVPSVAKGALYDLQVMKKGKGQLPVKQGMDIKKYGGYNNISGSYFCLVEHIQKKKIVRSIVPVFTFAQGQYEEDPAAYLTKTVPAIIPKLVLTQPKVIIPKIMCSSLLELNGIRLMITSRSEVRDVYKHAYQLIIDDEKSDYLKRLAKYVDRCMTESKELEPTEKDDISKKQNLIVYEWFVQKMKDKPYDKLFANLANELDERKNAFISISILKQAQTLLSVLKIFKCDRQLTSLKLIGGSSNVGIIRYSCHISSLKTAYLIHQSVTGLYEHKIDLLK